jgi:hypothetical protein
LVELRRIGLAALTLTVSVAVTACGGDDSAAPPSDGSDMSAVGGSTPTNDRPGDDPLLQLDPCTMLSAADVRATGVERRAEPRHLDSDSTKECIWGESYATQSLSVKLKEGDPERAKPAGASPRGESTMDGRQVRQYTEDLSLNRVCTSVMVLSAGSYVRVQFSDSGTVDEVCATVDRLLPLVSAKLPG